MSKKRKSSIATGVLSGIDPGTVGLAASLGSMSGKRRRRK